MSKITAFVAAVGQVTTIAKAFWKAGDDAKRARLEVEFSHAVLELHQKQLAVVEDYQVVLESNVALKKQLADYDKWEQERTRYSLCDVGSGTMVRVLDPDKARGEPLHWLCTHCYESRKKGFFHKHGRVFNHYKCDGCGSEIDALKQYPKG